MKNQWIVYGLVLSVLGGSAFASDIYVGVEGGFQSLNSDMSVSVVDADGINQGNNSSSATADGGVGDVFVGVVSQPIPHKMSLALEANLTGFSAETSASYYDSYTDFTARTQWKYNFGVSLIPGYLLTDTTTLYARMGIGYGEYTSKGSGNVDKFAPAQNIPGYLGDFIDHDFSYRLGAGVETAITPKWYVRLEYDYWHYNAVDPDDFSNENQNVVSYTFHPSSNTVMLGVSYHFYQSGGADLVL